jgi:hypothetical protein
LIGAIHTTSGDDFVGAATAADWGGTVAVQYSFGRIWTVRGGVNAIRRDVSSTDRAWKPQGFVLGAVNVLHAYVGSTGKYEAGASIIGGYGYSALPDGGEQNLLVGVDLAGVIGLGGWFVEPSVVPRWSWRHTKTAAGAGWQTGFGLSAAVTVGFPFALRLQFAGERVFLGAGEADPPGWPETKTYSWSVGILWAL